MTNPQDAWFPVLGMRDVPAGFARAVSLQDQDIVVWRSDSGVVNAWKNQCPHRGMRLSFGQVRGERLMCRYHGWQFDLQGRCKTMPAQPDVTPAETLCTSAYHCREHGGLVWVCLDEESANDTPGAFAAPDLNDNWRFCRTLYTGQPLQKVGKLLHSLQFPLMPNDHGCTETDRPVTWSYRQVAANILVVSAEQKNQLIEQLLIGLQPVSPGSSALHLCIPDAPDPKLIRERLHRFNDWARTLRWFLHHPGAEYDGVNPLPRSPTCQEEKGI